MKKYKTIKDIAKLAKVSSSTVSRVVNKKSGNYSKKTEEKILKLVNKYHYSPNLIAKSLKTKRTKTIGIIVPDITNVIFSQLYKAMTECARKRGYTVILGCSYYDNDKEEDEVDVMLNKLVDGMIFCGGFDELENIEKVNKLDIPMVIAERFNFNNNFPSVQIDNALAVEKSIDYLVRFGHRDISYISFSPKKHFSTKERCNGFVRGLKKNNINFNPEKLIIDESLRLNEIEGTSNLIKKMFKEGRNMPTAFVVLADVFAIGLFKGLKKMGFNIPKDISVVGFDDSIICEYLEPSLTTVNWQEKTMGTESMNLVIDIIEGKDIKNKNIVLPAKIIERESVGSPRKKNF